MAHKTATKLEDATQFLFHWFLFLCMLRNCISLAVLSWEVTGKEVLKGKSFFPLTLKWAISFVWWRKPTAIYLVNIGQRRWMDLHKHCQKFWLNCHPPACSSLSFIGLCTRSLKALSCSGPGSNACRHCLPVPKNFELGPPMHLVSSYLGKKMHFNLPLSLSIPWFLVLFSHIVGRLMCGSDTLQIRLALPIVMTANLGCGQDRGKMYQA